MKFRRSESPKKQMPSFPLTQQLPPLIETKGWLWQQLKSNKWIGTDLNGNRWLTKLRGASFAYREIVFSKLAQGMGWSCQSSSLIRIDHSGAQILGVDCGAVHSAHWFLDEHATKPCNGVCPFGPWIARTLTGRIDELEECPQMLYRPKVEIAADLFGCSDGPDVMFLITHEPVIIDSEQMFFCEPTPIEGSPWLNNSDGSPCLSGRRFALGICRDVLSLSDAQIHSALMLPDGISIPELHCIARKISCAREIAAEYLASYGKSL